MKNIFKRAHEMTREIKAEYPEVDYRTQFGLCLSYLLNKKEEKEMIKNSKWVKENDDKTFDEITDLMIDAAYDYKGEMEITATLDDLMKFKDGKWFVRYQFLEGKNEEVEVKVMVGENEKDIKNGDAWISKTVSKKEYKNLTKEEV